MYIVEWTSGERNLLGLCVVRVLLGHYPTQTSTVDPFHVISMSFKGVRVVLVVIRPGDPFRTTRTLGVMVVETSVRHGDWSTLVRAHGSGVAPEALLPRAVGATRGPTVPREAVGVVGGPGGGLVSLGDGAGPRDAPHPSPGLLREGTLAMTSLHETSDGNVFTVHLLERKLFDISD